MSTTLENMKGNADKALDLFRLPGKTAEALVYGLAGEPVLPKVRRAAVDSLWNVAAFGPRTVRDIAVGMLKGTLHLTWNMIKLLPLPFPILKNWEKERGAVTLRTQDALEQARKALDLFKPNTKFPPLFTQGKETSHALAA